MKSSHKSVAEMFLDRVSSTPDAESFSYPTEGEVWKSLTWRQTGDRVRKVACGLRALGITDEQRVAILSNTRIDWILADIGILCAGGATTTIYPSNTAEECAFIVSDSDTVIVFAENADQVKKVLSVRADMPSLKHVIAFDGAGSDDGFVLTLADLESKGEAWDAANPGSYESNVDAIEPSRLATLIYTSGTTGRPKGVELTHDCWVYEGAAIMELGFISSADKQYLWLPLSHSFGKVLESLVIAGGIPTAVDGRIDKIIDNLAVVKPSFMAAAPRIFEKVYNKVVTGAQEAGGLKLTIFRWALGVGREVSKVRQGGGEPAGFLALKYAVADKLVFSKLRARFGGRIRFFISGSAPLSREMAEFFHAADLLILEGYGLTESSAASFVNRPTKYGFGTVGLPLPGTEIQIAPEDGEIFIRGRGIMRGYRGLPDVTAETLTDDGWLRTGDIGELTADGMLKITDRKKDLIKTSGGKYVAPQSLEGKLKALNPYLSQVVVHGDNRNYCVALVTLDPDSIVLWAKEHGMSDKSYEQLTQDDQVKAMVDASVKELNAGLARYETLKYFAILPRDFSVESGELTPSLKVKRKVVEKQYATIIDGFYQGALAEV